MASERRVAAGVIGGCFLLILATAFLINGPGGLKNRATSWRANWGGGTHWLVVQYAVNGDVINYWDITGTLSHEGNGDGIYFTTDHGIVHLSGHFVYVQDPTDEAKAIYLKRPKPS